MYYFLWFRYIYPKQVEPSSGTSLAALTAHVSSTSATFHVFFSYVYVAACHATGIDWLLINLHENSLYCWTVADYGKHRIYCVYAFIHAIKLWLVLKKDFYKVAFNSHVFVMKSPFMLCCSSSFYGIEGRRKRFHEVSWFITEGFLI